MAATSGKVRVTLCHRVTCPHCWHGFAPDEVLWVSQHPELMGDSKIAEDYRRFLPTRFTAEGEAIDAGGFPCHTLACPNCHLTVPRAMLEMEPFFMSILGSPSSGKSYFLASVTWRLRHAMMEHFAMSFADADPTTNAIVNGYEELLFFDPSSDKPIWIVKTEATSLNHFDTVLLSGERVTFPRPFVFTLRPTEQHPNYDKYSKLSRAVCMYDNAGENFERGVDKATAPVTRHMAHSKVLFFLYDPTQEPRFRDACQGRSHDPQMQGHGRTYRQELVLLEAADRVRRHTGLPQNEKHARPLIVVVTKYDAWSSLLDNRPLRIEDVIRKGKGPASSLHLDTIHEMSAAVRNVLLKHSPQMVAAAEGFAKQVVYIPVSALGRSPEVDAKGGGLVIRPKDIRPMWTEVPFIYALCRWQSGLIGYVRPKEQNTGAAVVKMDEARNEAAERSNDPPYPRAWKEAGA